MMKITRLVNCIWPGRPISDWWEAIALGFPSVMTFVTRHVPCENSGIFVYGAISRDNSFNLEYEASEPEWLRTCPLSPELSSCMPAGIAPTQWCRPLQGLPLKRNACCYSSGIVFSVLSLGWIQSQIRLLGLSQDLSQALHRVNVFRIVFRNKGYVKGKFSEFLHAWIIVWV